LVSDWLLPFAGYRSYNSSVAGGMGSYGNYWSSTPNGNITPYRLYFSSGVIMPQANDNGPRARMVRCIKDTKNPDNILTIDADG
jgi:hypothetical protein